MNCLTCGDEMTKQESIQLLRADEETYETLERVGRFCSIKCGESHEQ